MQTKEQSASQTTTSKIRFAEAPIDGVYILPKMFWNEEIEELLELKDVKSHHDDDSHGGYCEEDDDDYEEEVIPEPEEPDEKKDDKKKVKSKINYFRASKPHALPWVAERIQAYIPEIKVGVMRPSVVDPDMQLYRLPEGAGAVPQHIDEDFDGLGGSRALYSILVYLNCDYAGGETVFNGNIIAPRVPPGGGLLFRHDIPHEGFVVVRGEKYILKTDLFFK